MHGAHAAAAFDAEIEALNDAWVEAQLAEENAQAMAEAVADFEAWAEGAQAQGQQGQGMMQGQQGRGMTRAVNEIRNLQLHGPWLVAMADAPPKVRRVMLADATDSTVRALATATRLAMEKGVKIKTAHRSRAHKMASKNAAMKTKRRLVRGEPGKVSRGGGFFKDLINGVAQVAPLALAAL